MLPGKMGKMLQKAQKAQAKVQEEIAALEMEGSAGGGVVTVVVDGQKNVRDLKISEDVFEEPDAGMISDLVLAAISDAQRRIDDEVEAKMAKLAGQLGLPPGMGL